METTKLKNPFPGLRPFRQDEHHLFFGRDGQTDALLERLQEHRFLAVVGTSGSGKSSLVRAGLLPAIHGGLLSDAGSHWRIAIMRPGDRPIHNLAQALNEPDVFGVEDDQADFQTLITEATLQRSDQGLIQAVRLANLPDKENVLIVVDQFEELFRFQHKQSGDASRDRAAAFVKLLLQATKQQDHGIYVVITMRSDFLGDCSQFRDLPEAINESQYLIPRMTRDQRRDAIKGPVGVAGGTISPSLVQELLNDMGDDPDQLPILQHALMRTWEESAPEGHLELDDYKEVGGMADALSIHADEALEDLTKGRSPEKSVRLHLLAQRLFRAITERGPDNREVRRPMLLKDICEIADCSEEEMIEVIEIFRAKQRSFLMPPAPTPLTGDSRIDISHESLIRQWVSLKQWVANEAHDVETYLRLAQDAQRHAAGTYDLLGKTSEEFNRTWWDEAQITSGWAGYQFNSLSREEVLDYLDRSRQQWIDEEEARIQAERDRLRRTRQFATVLGLVLGTLGFLLQ